MNAPFATPMQVGLARAALNLTVSVRFKHGVGSGSVLRAVKSLIAHGPDYTSTAEWSDTLQFLSWRCMSVLLRLVWVTQKRR
ncbi:MAG: hypothetical protein DMG23_15470 [Acidobacteria bacterium]|nr:MAG: hypothetical protein DMG23_15470 [Acidobacteriota bacterium]